MGFTRSWGYGFNQNFHKKEIHKIKKGHITESEENNPLEEILQLLREAKCYIIQPIAVLPPWLYGHIQMSMYSRNREMYTGESNDFEELINVLEKP